jgi:Fe(3+) dicitrate transport protein
VIKNFITLVFCFICLCPISFSQNSNKVFGKIVDGNGEIVSGASVRLVDMNLSAITNESGEFSFPVNAKIYRIEVSAKGFAKVIVSVPSETFATITLQPAKVAEIVSISSSYLIGSDEALEETGGSVQKISSEELERSRVFTSSEALRKISGVNVRDEEGFGLRPNIGIRGTNPTRSTKILLLEDGLPLSYAPYGDNATYYHPPLERFESVEVLKGSGQISYGPTTVAGVVNYITPNPPSDTTLSLKLISGNRDFANGNAQFGGTFGKTGVIVNFNQKQGEGARENIRSRLSDFSSKFMQTINSKNILIGKFSVLKEDSQITYSGLTEAEFRTNPRGNPFLNDHFDAYRTGISLQHTAVLNARSNLNTTGYYNFFSRDWWRQSSNSSQRPNRIGSMCRGMIDLYTTCGNEGRLRDYKTFGIEPRFNSNFILGKTRNDLNIGFRFHGEKQNRIQKNGLTPQARDGGIVEDNLRENTALSGFAQNRIIWNRFSLTGGLRIEHIYYKRTNELTNLSGKTKITEVLPGIGFAVNLFKNSTVFGGIHRGFAPPRAEDIVSNSGGIVELEAEKSWNYEIGIRSRPFIGLSLETTYFRTNYENQIVPASISGGIGAVFTNGGRTLHQGIETNSRVDSAAFLKKSFNLYFQTAFTNLFSADFIGTRFSSVSGFSGTSVAGNRLPYAPKQLITSSIGFSYKSFDGFVENNYIGRQFSDDLNAIDSIANGQRGAIPSQTYWNATANYKIEKLKSVLFVTGKNLFDRTFIVDRSRGILPSRYKLVGKLYLSRIALDYIFK